MARPARTNARLATLVLALVLALPAAAAAQSPITLGPGVQAGLTVDAAGTAYISWIGHEPGVTSLHFCRIPRGATACAVNTTVAVPGTSLTRPYVVVDGGTIRILSYRYGLSGPSRFDAVYMLTSTDGGATFDAGTQVGVVNPYDAIRGPGGRVSLIGNVSVSPFQTVPIDGSGPELARADLSPSHPYDPAIALVGPSELLAVFSDGSGNPVFRRWLGTGDPNAETSWTPPQTISGTASYNRLATGPSGTFLVSTTFSTGTLEVRRFDGSGFGAPLALPEPAHPLTGGSHDFFQDPAGRLHAIWPFGDADGTHIAYATSDDGTAWRASTFDVTQNPDDVGQAANAMQIAVAADHLGFATWETPGSGGGAEVHAIAIGPGAGVAGPVIGKTATATPVRGVVRVKFPPGTSVGRAKALGLAGATRGFIPLEEAADVPIGSTFDTTKGTVALATARGAGRPDQTGQFNGSRFVLQQKTTKPLTTLSLKGSLGKCATALPKGGSRKPLTTARRRRSLFSNARGAFRTRGRNATATVRGTRWRMTDSCSGTLTIVRSGSVIVRDLRLRKTRRLRAGQRYFARAVRKHR